MAKKEDLGNNGAIDNIGMRGLNPSLFPDIKPTDPVTERRAKILKRFASGIGDKTPYDSSEFECVSPIGEEARIVLVSGMTSLPGKEGLDLFRASKNLEYISHNQASHRALDRMYTGPVAEDSEGNLWSRLFIENTHNAMAVRNRLRIVKNVFTDHMKKTLAEKEGPLQVLSVAAGSSRAIMESLKSLNGTASDRISLQMVDSSSDALTDGQELVNNLGIKELVKFTEASFLHTTRYMNSDYHPEFVEVVGLFDYLQDKRIVHLLGKLRSQMTDGAAVIYSNIAPNDEKDFTHQVVGWQPMEYRTQQDLARLAESAGFKTSNIRIIREPLGVYNLAVITK